MKKEVELSMLDLVNVLRQGVKLEAVYSGAVQTEILRLMTNGLDWVEYNNLDVYIKPEEYDNLTEESVLRLFARLLSGTGYETKLNYFGKKEIHINLQPEKGNTGVKKIINLYRATKGIKVSNAVLPNGQIAILDHTQYLAKVLMYLMKYEPINIESYIAHIYLYSINAGMTNKEIQKDLTEKYKGKPFKKVLQLTSGSTSELQRRYGVEQAKEMVLKVTLFVDGLHSEKTATWNGRRWL